MTTKKRKATTRKATRTTASTKAAVAGKRKPRKASKPANKKATTKTRSRSKGTKTPKRGAKKKVGTKKAARKTVKRTTAERIENLEAEVASLRRATRSATARTAFAANATHIVGLSATDAGGATLEFTKAEGSPNFVRVSVRGHPGYVINVGEKSGELKGLTAGTFIIVRMEVQGNPLDKATVKFNEGSPDVMTIEIPKDDNANSGVQTVAVL